MFVLMVSPCSQYLTEKSKRVLTVQLKDAAHYLTRARLCGLLDENFLLYAFTSGKPVIYSV